MTKDQHSDPMANASQDELDFLLKVIEAEQKNRHVSDRVSDTDTGKYVDPNLTAEALQQYIEDEKKNPRSD